MGADRSKKEKSMVEELDFPEEINLFIKVVW